VQTRSVKLANARAAHIILAAVAPPRARAALRAFTMSTLRVLLTAVPAADTIVAWALFDAEGRLLRTGDDVPAEWPDAVVHEAVLAPGCARLVSVALPPLPPARVGAAVRFALDDQLAAPGDSLRVLVMPQAADGRVRAIVIDGALVSALAAYRPAFARVLFLPTLFAADGAWHWVDGFAPAVRFLLRPDGSALAADDPHAAEVALALRAALATGTAAPRVLLHATNPGESVALSAATGCPWEPAPAWQWSRVPATAFAAAPDLLAGPDGVTTTQGLRPRLLAALRPATRVAAGALAVFLLGLVVSWGYAQIAQWQSDARLVALAHAAGIAEVDTPATAGSAIAARYRDVQHAAGREAPDDALPLLAAAAPALAALPAGSLKRATYSAGAWTFELAALDANARTALDARLAAAGLNALSATGRDGMRLRVTP
jgi:hypothetical protein